MDTTNRIQVYAVAGLAIAAAALLLTLYRAVRSDTEARRLETASERPLGCTPYLPASSS